MQKKVKIIAEAGCNHNGSIKLAYKMIDEAKKAKADAVKFQLYRTEHLVTQKAKKAKYALLNTNKKQTQYQMQKKLEFNEHIHKRLKKYCEKKNIEYLCSAFDIPSIKVLNQLNLKTFKVPSGEINNFPYLKYLGSLNKKIILSTGMSKLSEINEAMKTLIRSGTKKNNIIILQCNSEYPSPYTDINLRAMVKLGNKYKINFGLSDHSLGIEVPIAAVALGAKIIEKHFTLNKNFNGPDHKASLLPFELKNMVKSIRNTELAMGSDKKFVTKSEKKNINVARKSIVAIKLIKKGDIFNTKNIGIKRPGNGISPSKYYNLLGKKSKKKFQTDDLIKL